MSYSVGYSLFSMGGEGWEGRIGESMKCLKYVTTGKSSFCLGL